MYFDNGICWKEEAKRRNIYIFGGGKNGQWLYNRLKDNGINSICGVIDNDKETVASFSAGKKWIDNAMIPEKYLEIADYKSDLIIISTDFVNVKKQLTKMGIFNYIAFDQIDLSVSGESHYDSEYFDMQLEYAKVDSILDAVFFQKYIYPESNIAEFGSGGCLLLNKIQCKSKVGIEINPFARKYAESLNVKTVEKVEELEDESLDIVISTHALEHCLSPYEIVCGLYRKLKVGGKAIVVVPYEPLSYGYMLNDISQHLYTWTERTLGNLFRAANFYIRETGTSPVAWPDNWKKIFGEVSMEEFEAISSLESSRTGYYSVYVVAEKV